MLILYLYYISTTQKKPPTSGQIYKGCSCFRLTCNARCALCPRVSKMTKSSKTPNRAAY
uniref:Uncharacterized protein n=1 Tax=Setaria italica TaxID=4555 RepID=K3ZYX4_SETIT